DKASAEQPDRRFAWILAVAETKEDGEDDGRGPEAERFAVAGHTRVHLDGPLVKAGKSACECVQEIAAGGVLLEQPDQKEAEQPDRSVAENIGAKEQAAVDDEEPGFQEG